MSTSTKRPYLPSEILLQIIEHLVPPSAPIPIALPPSHITAKTLLSLTRTCRRIYPAAVRLLYTHCLYIDSPDRLQCVVETLYSISDPAQHPPPLTGSTVDGNPQSRTRITQYRTLPDVAICKYISSLYLEPFDTDSINDRPQTVLKIYDLLSFAASALRRLVLDIPLRSLETHRPPERELQLVLEQAFVRMEQLEIFCSVRDELFLGHMSTPWGHTNEPQIWSRWPKLKMLALYNVDASSFRFWSDLAKLQHLETLILTRSDGIQESGIRGSWGYRCEEKELSVVLVNVESEHRFPVGKDSWTNNGKDKLIVREVNVPISYYGDENAIELCQAWVRRRILRGEETIES